MLYRRAIYLALKHFFPALKDRHVLIQTDSTLAVYHENHQQDTKSRQGLWMMQLLLMWVIPHFPCLGAIHFTGVQNSVANSVCCPTNRVCELHALLVSQICMHWYPGGSGGYTTTKSHIDVKRAIKSVAFSPSGSSEGAEELSELLCPRVPVWALKAL